VRNGNKHGKGSDVLEAVINFIPLFAFV